MERNPIGWKTDLIDNIFLEFEGNQIKQIPLVNKDIEDQLMWMGTQDVNYTVKSGYATIQQWKNNNQPSNSSGNSLSQMWKKLSYINTIPRHQIIIWRILNKAIPVRDELMSRGIKCPMLCPRCNMKVESINHAFMSFKRVTKVWFGSSKLLLF